MKGSIWTVVVVAVVITVAFLAIPAALSNNADVQQESETHTLKVTNESELGAAGEWYRLIENETVEDAENATVYERGTDYLIDYQNGTLNATQGGDAGGEEVVVSYHYETIDEQSEDIAGLLATAEPIIPLLLLITALGAVLAMLGWW